MTIWISIGLITLCAVCWDVGVVLQKQAADVLPPLELNRELPRTLWTFVTSWKWMGGLVISGAGWGLFAFALNYTPISLARAIQGSGFVILAFFSIIFLKHPLKFWEWTGVIVVTAGIVALGLSEPIGNETTTVFLPLKLVPATLICLAVVFAMFALRKFANFGFEWVVVFSVVAGTMLGLGDVFTKGILVEAGAKAWLIAFGLIGPAMVFFYLTGFFILSRGYQHGRAILVTAISDFCARLVTIFLGIFAMGEAFPAQALYRDLRIAGLVAILGGTVLLARFSGEQVADELKERMKGEG